VTPATEFSEAKTRGRWRKNYRLGEGCSIKHGFAFKGALMTTDGSEELPIVVNIVNFQYTGGFRFETTKIQRYAGPFPDEYILKPGSVLVVMTCQTPKGEILGVPGRIPRDRHKYLHNQRLGLACVKDPSAVDLDYLYYLFLSPRFNAHLFGTATGAKILHTAPSRIEDYRLDCPPAAVQRKIAAILAAYDNLIENNTRRIRILEEMAQAIYREWFVHFRFPSHKKVKMVNSPFGPIPEGWAPNCLGDLAEEIRRSVQPAEVDPNTPYVGLEHIPRNSIAMTEWAAASQVRSTKLAFKQGEILFGKIRPYFHKVVVAPLDGVCSSDTIVIRPKRLDGFGLVLACVSSEPFVSHATQTSQGTKMPRANWDVLLKYPVPTPPDSLLAEFNERMGETVNLIQNLVFQVRNLRRTRDLLLPRLISGELDVSDLDINVGDAAA